MTITTNVPGLVLTAAGWQAPTEQAILSGVQTDINQAFGGNLNPGLQTPQGQLASSITAILANVNSQVINLFNMFDPAYAYGRAQDALARLYFLSRLPALPTVVDCICTGGAGTVIPIGSVAKSEDGFLYNSTEAGVIGNDGTVTISFSCNTYGPIACPANTLDQIFRAIPGWDTVTNPTDGVLGRDTESRSQFEERLLDSVALNAVGSLNAVQGAVLSVDDVLDAYVTENVSASSVTIRGVSVAAKSIYVSAVGGTDADVAQAIWSKKAPGCAYNGNTTVTYVNNNGVYSPPYPSYNVSFQRPSSLPIIFSVFLQNNAGIPSDAAQQIQAAIMLAFAGADGGTRARIGSDILASRYYAPVANLGSWAQVLSIQVGSQNNSDAASFTGVITAGTLSVSGVTGTIVIGQTLFGANIPAGTIITAGSGSTWTLNNSITVSSEAMKSAKPNANVVSVNADQVPTINANNIAVTTT